MNFLTYFRAFSYAMIARGDAGPRVGWRAQHRSGAGLFRRDDRELDAREYEVAIARTLRSGNCPPLDPALLRRLAISKSDGRTSREARRNRPGPPDRFSFSSETLAGQERSRLGFSLLDLILRSSVSCGIEFQPSLPRHTHALSVVRSIAPSPRLKFRKRDALSPTLKRVYSYLLILASSKKSDDTRGVVPKLLGLPFVAVALLVLIFGLALPLFLIAPRSGAAALTRSGGGLSNFIGFSENVTLGQIGTLKQDDGLVMRVRVEDTASSDASCAGAVLRSTSLPARPGRNRSRHVRTIDSK